MPYIITTKRPDAYELLDCPEQDAILSRRAVATLEEAREAASQAIYASDLGDNDGLDFYESASGLSESGGTIGPLPDGTVIEVEQVSPLMLAAQAKVSGDLMMACVNNGHDYAPIIDAYNAKHS